MEAPKNGCGAWVGFNVNAYNEVAQFGSGRWVSLKSSKQRKPVVDESDPPVKTGNIHVVTADTYVETAWKDGKMVFLGKTG